MKRLVLGLLALMLLSAAGLWAWLSWYGWASRSDPDFFEEDIAAFEAEDAARAVPHGGVLFYGSSSIRLWSSLAEDMAPLPVLNRGFGGAQMSHVARYAERVVLAPEPAAVVVYAGDNDLDASTGKTAETVLQDFESFLQVVQPVLPTARIYFLAIKPSRLRWERWPEMSRANELVRRRTEEDPRLGFIDIAPVTLGPDGRPREELFAFDGLHLSEAGYAAWSGVVRPVLLRDLPELAGLPSGP